MQIPTFPKFDIAHNGTITEIKSGMVVPEKPSSKGLRSVIFHDKGRKKTRSVPRLILQTFHPVNPGLSDDWLSVRYIDGDRTNIHESNLEWTNELFYPSVDLGVTHQADEWMKVPGYKNFEIRFVGKRAQFRNSNTNRLSDLNISSSGYVAVKDSRERYILVHRLVAGMFLVHPLDVEHLTVNHIDSDRDNNLPENLEWVTQVENLQHGLKYGSRTNNKERKVTMLCVKSKLVYIYPSINEAARYLDSNPGMIHDICTQRQRRGLPYKGFLLKLADDETPWELLKEDIVKNKEAYRIAVKDMLTEEVVIYNSLMETVSGEYINPKTVRRLLQSKIMIPWNNKCFQLYKPEGMIWPNYPKEIVIAFSKVIKGGRPLKVTYSDGTVEFVAGVTEWCNNHLNLKPQVAVVNRAIIRDGEWCGIKFEHINLHDYQ